MRPIPLLVLSACGFPDGSSDGDCATFDEIAYTDPDGVTSDNDFTRVRFVFEEVASASGLDGLCVPEVRFVPEGTCEGTDPDCYQGAGEPILIGSSSVWDVRRAVCAALADQGIDDELYDTLFYGELDFKDACALFPAALALDRSAEGTCPTLSVGSNAATFLMERMFPLWEVPVGDPIDVALERHEVTGLEETLGSLVISGGSFYAEEGEEAVVRIDPATFSVQARFALPARSAEAREHLVPTDGAPLLVVSDEATAAWRLDESTGTWMATPFPTLEPGGAFYTTAAGDTAWFLGDDGTDVELLEVDLVTGGTVAFEGPSLLTAGALMGAGEELVGIAATDLLEDSIVFPNTTANTYTTVPAPYDWHLFAPARVGDRVVAAWSENDAQSLVVYEDGEWRLAADPCGTGAVGYHWPAVSDDGLWLWEADDGAPGGAWITEVALGP
jgi:hypothetical protein